MKKLCGHNFETPSYLGIHSLSFDISEEFIRYGELKETSVGLSLGHFGEQKIPNGVIVGSEIKDEVKLISLLKNIRIHERIYFARIALPDTSNDTIKQYLKILKRAGFVPLSLELGIQSLVQAIIPQDDLKPIIIVDFGETQIDFSVVIDRQTFFTTKLIISDVSLLGDVINKQYIKWKKEYGNVLQGKTIESILLCGKYGNTALLLEYITTNMKIKAEYANVWINVSDMKITVPKMSFEESLSYGKVIGLALEDYMSIRESRVNLLPQAEKKIINREYKLRLATDIIYFISLILAFTILLLFPLYFISINRMNIAEHNLEIFNNSMNLK